MDIYTFCLPHGCKTDGGPSFKGRFKEYLSGMGIKCIQTSAYNAQSNGLAECGVRQVKDVLKKIGKTKKVSDDLLKEIVFYLNAHRQKDQGSPHERFFRRGVRNRLPNSINREIDHRVLIARRY